MTLIAELASMTDRLARSPTALVDIRRANGWWVIDCVNCDCEFSTSPFEAVPFCSVNCRNVARTVRWLRHQVTHYGSMNAWPQPALQEMNTRLDHEQKHEEFGARWTAQTPQRACDDDSWNFTWQEWVTVHRHRPDSLRQPGHA
jgi:hypothetical protein